ncbi:sushi, von Willebrand factor type A, EGF and pentraxin domain-containing protein 1-like [Clarias gariepinus]|uniref:sushi, von Willebrand factor type A, EGF and pentraxin domain-containing protein 1-like n=1 Tax=Clarias gariepinus TaxID=13013 RepID=UPI00234DF9F1|nr:sushi, von Willebrand factor type A, EGF and pentraxin domain-containing protein 1-like [Clarias gariepinus]
MPLPCPAGTYTNLTGQDKCSLCHAGYYCPESTNNYTKFPCPPGFYCPDGTTHATQFPCPRGYYNPEPMTQSLDSCLPCLPGHYCEKERLTAVSGKCKAGWFCVSAAWNPQPFDLDNYTSANCLCPASSTGGRCQAGFFCPAGSSEPTPCPPGAFCNSTGYWCPPGQTDDLAVPCPLGHHCPPGSPAPVLCPSGTYQDKKKQANCTVCEEGFYCDDSFGVNNVSVLQSCPKGYYCPKGTRYATQFPCPVGSYNPKEGADSLSSCLLCPAGHFCPFFGLAEPAGLCISGYWCREGSHSASPSAGPSGSLCPVGHYCPNGTISPMPCPLGTLSNSTGLRSEDECQPCPRGFYCATTALSLPTGLCSEGPLSVGPALLGGTVRTELAYSVHKAFTVQKAQLMSGELVHQVPTAQTLA